MAGNLTVKAPDGQDVYDFDLFTFALLRQWLYMVLRASVPTSPTASSRADDVSQAIYDQIQCHKGTTGQNCSGIAGIMERIAVSLIQFDENRQ